MDASKISSHLPSVSTASAASSGHAATAGGMSAAVSVSSSASGHLDGEAANASSKTIAADTLQQAIKKLPEQVPAASSVTLEAGLDPNGGHPGQVLIKLSDKVTKQTFYQYYVPAEQVVKSAESGTALNPGSLMHTKA